MATLVFGGTGLVGRALADLTGEDKSNNGYVFLSSKDCDLLNREQTEMILAHYKPQLVIHLAAVVGGLYMNISENRRMFYDN
ncbi:NAD-dependent epimerase/dehydratase family protein, partial [Candidatus Saccharibacteria bacterium]|nr:NAD-dependent epimerase/dehydratase family protein [Candidatus Saccharibacteria bacterium]